MGVRPPSRLSEMWLGRTVRNKVVFSGTRRRMTSVAVRGDQMASAMGGICIRSRFLTAGLVASSPALIWIVEPDLALVKKFGASTIQILDVINPGSGEDRPRFFERCAAFQHFILNTRTSRAYLGPRPNRGWNYAVIPHHHCNFSGWMLPEERLAHPMTVGYVGQPEHLHDAEEIERSIRSLGMRFVSANTTDLSTYREIDIGIAWTRRDRLRDDTRSNVKLANFAAHGIPSVMCDYTSYHDMCDKLGEICLIRESLGDFISGIAELAHDEALRRSVAEQARTVQDAYSIETIADEYRAFIRLTRAAR